MRRLLLCLSVLVGLLWSGDALAQACTVTVSAINFGTVTGLAGTTVDATGTISATCNSTNGVLLCYHIGRGGGQGFGAGQRTIANGGATANIEFYADAARTDVWRTVSAVSASQGTYPLIVPGGNSVTRTQTIYARMTISAGVPGTYATTFTNFTDDRIIGDFIEAGRACELGLVNRVVSENDLSVETQALADKIAGKLAVAVKIGKEAFYAQLSMPTDQAYAYTGDVMVENMLHRDTKEGISAFLEKRDPEWEQ